MASKEACPKQQAHTAVRVQVHMKIQQVLVQETHHVQDAVQINIKEYDAHGRVPAQVQLHCPIGHVSIFKSA
jgi:hypothetical protein